MSDRRRYFYGTLLILVTLGVLAVTVVKGGEITITDQPMMAPYPANVKTMTDAEFYSWAVKRNKKAEDDWQTAYDWAGNPYVNSYDTTVTKDYSSTSTHSSTISLLGSSRTPGQSYGTLTSRERVTHYRRPNPDFVHPGPLTIINPYVRPR